MANFGKRYIAKIMARDILIIARRELMLKIKSKVIASSVIILTLVAAITPWISHFAEDKAKTSSSRAALQSTESTNFSIALFALVLLYMIISLSGSFLALTIIEEKSGRIMEVLLSAVSPRKLLLGKIFGLLTFSIGQFLLIVTTWLVSSQLAGSPAVSGVSAADLAIYLLWFLPAVIAFSFIYGGLGALISRSEDSGALQGPMSILLIGIVYLASYSLTNPNAEIVKVSRFIPPFSYFVGLGQLLILGKITEPIIISYVASLIFTCATVYFALSAFDANLLENGKFSFKKFFNRNLSDRPLKKVSR